MAQPQLLAMLSNNLQAHQQKEAETVSKEPAVTLVSQSVEIIVAPKEKSPTPKLNGFKRSNLLEGAKPRDLTKKWSVPTYEVDPEEEIAVNAMRQELIGKTITGTFFMKDQPPHVKHWIRWNEKKCDNVYIPRDLAFEVFGGQPVSGAKVKCIITALGPETATAWRKHPQCEMFEIINRTYKSLDPAVRAASNAARKESRVMPAFRTNNARTTTDSRSPNERSPTRSPWSSRRTTAQTARQPTIQIPSLSTLPSTRSTHLTSVFRNNAAKWRSSNSLNSITELEG